MPNGWPLQSCRSTDSYHTWRRQAYDAEDFVNELRSMNVTPHVAQNTRGRQRIRKRIEEAFG